MPRITWVTETGLEVARNFRALKATLSEVVVDGRLMMRQDREFVSADTPDRFVGFSIDEPEPEPAPPALAAPAPRTASKPPAS